MGGPMHIIECNGKKYGRIDAAMHRYEKNGFKPSTSFQIAEWMEILCAPDAMTRLRTSGKVRVTKVGTTHNPKEGRKKGGRTLINTYTLERI
jgi:hypothetical protein